MPKCYEVEQSGPGRRLEGNDDLLLALKYAFQRRSEL